MKPIVEIHLPDGKIYRMSSVETGTKLSIEDIDKLRSLFSNSQSMRFELEGNDGKPNGKYLILWGETLAKSYLIVTP